jgi:sigma-54 dependent transcriptional regulator, acetoin dehydrogenase operon transcriptional activator AcoR
LNIPCHTPPKALPQRQAGAKLGAHSENRIVPCINEKTFSIKWFLPMLASALAYAHNFMTNPNITGDNATQEGGALPAWEADTFAAFAREPEGSCMPIAGHTQANGAHPAGDEPLAEAIRLAHQRSQAFGIEAQHRPDFSSPPHGELQSAIAENQFLFQHAAPVMETLYDQIANTHSMVVLTSAQGMILHSLGDQDFLEKANRVALTPGMDWSERHKGTNAIGTALAAEEALTVLGSEHFLQANRFLACSCSPIFDPYGQVMGALDVTGDHQSFHQHTLALVRMSAQMIENHMFADVFAKEVRIHFHTRSEFLGTLVEGIVVFTPEGRFLSANRSAQFQIGLSINALRAHTFSSLFGLPISSLHEVMGPGMRAPKQMCLNNGVTVWCRAKFKTSPGWQMPLGTMISEPPATTHSQWAPDRAAQKPTRSSGPVPAALSSLHYLDTGDGQVASVIQKLRRIQGRDIPIMILGETGTGKDLLAQAIHSDSPRRGQPFVSVNCASIPETLIESELFGYEEGAFTGARKKGAVGRIQQAHKGTLFLDEIGDMPKHLQARLLRVLQERKVSPLGAGKEVEVDIAVVCATHKNLKEMIAKGEFREDLYYRLNGLVVRLPALRERTDFDVVTRKILDALCENAQQVHLSPAVMQLFRRFHWPGNFRQLHNLLRTAVVMVGCDGVIQPEHLPDDFLEEVAGVSAVPPQAMVLTRSAPEWAQEAAEHMSQWAPEAGDGGRLHDVALSTMAQALRQHKGNVSAAAKSLGVSRNTIYRKKDQLPPDVWT